MSRRGKLKKSMIIFVIIFIVTLLIPMLSILPKHQNSQQKTSAIYPFLDELSMDFSFDFTST